MLKLLNKLVTIAVSAVLLQAAPLVLFEDSFSGPTLSSEWVEEDGYARWFWWDSGNFATYQMTGTHLRIAIPAGAQHNEYDSHHASVVRPFLGSGTYETKIDTSVTGYQQFGMIFENTNAHTSVALMFYWDGTNFRAYVERLSEGEYTIHKKTVAGVTLESALPIHGPFYTRGSVYDHSDPTQRRWVFHWSRDGDNWVKIFDGYYEGALATENIGQIKQVGIWIGDQAEHYNAPDAPFSADFDYFRFQMSDVADLHARGSSGKIEVFWEPVAGATGYDVYRSTQPNSGFSLAGTTTSTQLIQTGLPNGTRFYYYARPKRGAQLGGISAVVSAVPHVTVLDALPANGLILALSASELEYNYSNGQKVTNWISAVGSQSIATSTGDVAPTYISSGIGGIPTVRFDGVDDYLNLPTGFQNFTAGMSTFIVMRPSALQTNFKILLLGNGTPAESVGIGRGTANGYQFFTGNSAGSVDWFEASAGPVAGEASLISVLLEPGAAESTQYAGIGTNSSMLKGDGVYVPPVVNRSVNYIGNSYWNDGRLQGDVSEVLIYNRLLTASERTTVHNYIQQKYGFGSPAPTFPPPLAAPTNIIASAADASVTVTWDPALRATGYKLYRRQGSNTTKTLLVDQAQTSYVDNSVVNGQSYHYSIEAYRASETALSTEVSAVPLTRPPLPTGIPTNGLILALDATAISQQLAPGQTVGMWPDATASRYNAVAPSGSAPILVANAIGGKPAMRFDGVDDHFKLPAGFSNFTSGISLFVVMRPNGPSTFWKILSLGNVGGAQAFGIGRSSENSSGFQYYTANQANTFDWYSTPSGIVTGEASLLSVLQESGSANSLSFSAVHKNNSSLAADDVYVPPIVDRSQNFIGKSPWNDGFFGGDIAEILLFNRLLAPTERTAIHNYINDKYGIGGLPGAFPPAMDPPQNLAATAGNSRVELGWSPSSRATGYKVLRRTGTASQYVQVADVASTSYADTAVVNGQTYTYVVRAYRESDVSADSPSVSATPLAPPALPAAIPANGLLIRLDAEGLAQQLPSGYPVSSWLDSSPSGNSAVATMGTPVLIHNAIGSNAALRFDGVDDAMQFPGGFANFTAGLSAYIVYRPAAIQNNNKLLLFGNSGGLDSIGIGNSGTGRELLFFNANASSFDWFVTSAGPAAQEASLLSILQEPGSPGGTSYAAVFKNGAFLGGDGVYVPQVVNRSFNYIGNSFWNDGRFAGDIAEIVVYNRLLTSTERAGLHNYFQQKYGFGGVSGTFPPGLAAPVNLTASAGDATVNLNWSSTAGAIGYRLYRKVGSGVPAIIATTSNQAYTDSSVANGQTYTYTVRAYNASQESDDSLPASASPIAPPAPPAGIPTDGLILSLNASTLASTLADGQPVSTWTDASSLRKNAYAPGAAPTFVASGIAGRPSVRFDGVDDYLALPAGFENFVNGLSIYMVVRPTAIHNYTKLLLLGNGSVGDSIGLSRASSSEGLLFLTGNSSGGVDWFQTSSGLPTGQASALSVLLEAGPAGSTRFAEIARNGVAIHQEEVFVPSVISRSINYIGNSYWSDGPFQGDFAEILIYNRLLTSAEESAIQTYFNQQYGVSFP